MTGLLELFDVNKKRFLIRILSIRLKEFEVMSWRFTAVSVGWAVLVSSIGLGAYVLYFDEYDTLFVCLLGESIDTSINLYQCSSRCVTLETFTFETVNFCSLE